MRLRGTAAAGPSNRSPALGGWLEKRGWQEYLHSTRAREVDIVFKVCPPKIFSRGLELGGGDGFQARLLSRYVERLVSTDVSTSIAELPPADGVSYAVCDAELVSQRFRMREFDLVFSSNVLEHVRNAGVALLATREVLADNGIAVHILPSPFWKFSHVVLHFPNMLFLALRRLTRRGGLAWLRAQTLGDASTVKQSFPNGESVVRHSRSLLSRLFIPEPHGVSKSNRAEFRAFSRARWLAEFAEAGFEIISVRKGPVSSGYGFRLDRVRALLEHLGMTSEYIFILQKRGANSPYRLHFDRADHAASW